MGKLQHTLWQIYVALLCCFVVNLIKEWCCFEGSNWQCVEFLSLLTEASWLRHGKSDRKKRRRLQPFNSLNCALSLWEYTWTTVDYVFGFRLHCRLPLGNMKWLFQSQENSLSSVSSSHLILSISLADSSGPPILPCLSVVDEARTEWSGGWERRKASEKHLVLLSVPSDKARLFSGVHNGTLQCFKTWLYLWISLRLRNSHLSGFHHCWYGAVPPLATSLDAWPCFYFIFFKTWLFPIMVLCCFRLLFLSSNSVRLPAAAELRK